MKLNGTRRVFFYLFLVSKVLADETTTNSKTRTRINNSYAIKQSGKNQKYLQDAQEMEQRHIIFPDEIANESESSTFNINQNHDTDYQTIPTVNNNDDSKLSQDSTQIITTTATTLSYLTTLSQDSNYNEDTEQDVSSLADHVGNSLSSSEQFIGINITDQQQESRSLEYEEPHTEEVKATTEAENSISNNNDYDNYYDNGIKFNHFPPPPVRCQSITCIRKCCLEHQLMSFIPPTIGWCVDRDDSDLVWKQPTFHQKSGLPAEPLSNVEVAYGDLNCNYGPIDPSSTYYFLPTGNLFNTRTEKEHEFDSYCIEIVKHNENKLSQETLSCIEPAVPSTSYLARMRTMPVLMFVSIVSLSALVVFYAIVPEFRDMQGLCRLSHAVCMLLAVSLTFSTHVLPPMTHKPCVAIGLLVHVLSIGAFLWLTVLCYDSQRFIRGCLSYRQRNSHDDRVYFRRYCVFAWGGTLLLGVVSMTLQLIPEEALPHWVIKPDYAKTRCFIHDDTLHLLAYHFGIVGTLFLANIIFLSQACYMLYEQGVAFEFLNKIKGNTQKKTKVPVQQTSIDDSVFDSSESCRTVSSSISSRIFPKLKSWSQINKFMNRSISKDSSVSLDMTGSTESQSTSDTRFSSSSSLSSISETCESTNDTRTVIDNDEDDSYNKAKQKLDKKDCNIRTMRGKGKRASGPSYVTEFWQRFQLFVLMALCWTTEVLSFVIPPREMWLVTDMINVLQGFVLLVLFLKYEKNRVKIKQAFLNIKNKYFSCCSCGTSS